MAGSDEPRLAVIEAVVDYGRRQSGKHLIGPREIEPAMLERKIAFRRIERDPNLIYCTPNNRPGSTMT